MGGAGSKHDTVEKYMKDLGVDGIIVLEWIFGK
jgi:hypothetical protein